MPVIEMLNDISAATGKLYDFLATDEVLGKDFEQYIAQNKIEIQTDAQFIEVATEYIFEGKMQTGCRVLDYYVDKNVCGKEILNSFKNAFLSVFEIRKISKNSFKACSLINEKEFNLIALAKTTNLRGIGIKDFMIARIIEFRNEFYILNIFDVLGSNSILTAQTIALKMLIENPSGICWQNEEKLAQLKKDSAKIYDCFMEYFKKDTVITTNSLADNLIQNFEQYYKGEKINLKQFVKEPSKYEFFEIEQNADDEFLKNASSGFAAGSKEYDVGLYVTKEQGLFAIPFLGTFEKIMEGADIEGAQECILSFLFDKKVPLSIIEKYKNKLDIFNDALQFCDLKKVSTFEEIVLNFKGEYLTSYNCSSIMALYNSSLFSDYIGFSKSEGEKNG